MIIYTAPALDTIIELLKREGLPTEDLQSSENLQFYGCGDRNSPSGIVGLETHAEYGLLRSLLVTQEARKQGLGKTLVRHVENMARRNDIVELYLLTETAEAFFKDLEFSICPRGNVPDEIRATAQFSSLCPGSAAVMKKQL